MQSNSRSADFKTLRCGTGNTLNLHLRHTCLRRSLLQPVLQGIQCRLFTTGQYFNPAIGQVADSAGQTQLPGPVAR